MTVRPRWSRELPGLVVVLLAGILYASLVPKVVLGGDNGEFALLAQVDGIAHPPGYPLYTGLLRLLSWIPAATPVQSAGYATALMATLQLLVQYAAARLWAVPPWAAALALGLYAGSSLSLHHYSHAEVFALNGLLVALILGLAAPRPWLRPALRLPSLSLVFGLGLSHHHSVVLVGPLVVFGALIALRSSRGCCGRVVVVSALAFACGCLPQLLLVIWSRSPDAYLYSPGPVESWGDFWHLFFRRDYGTFNLAAQAPGQPSDLLLRMGLLLRSLVEAWNVLLFVAVAAFVQRLRQGSSDSRWAWAMLLASLLLAGPLFQLRANIDLSGSIASWEVVERFYLLPMQLLLIPVAAGMQLGFAWVFRFLPHSQHWLQGAKRLSLHMVAAVVVAAGLITHAAVNVRATAIRRSASLEDYLSGLLHTLPPEAIVLASGDDELYAGSYLQRVAGIRPDVTLLNPAMLAKPWFARRLAERLPGCRWPPLPLAQFLELLVDQCRQPVFVSDTVMAVPSLQSLLQRRVSMQYGTLRRLVARGERTVPPAQLLLLNKQLFSRAVKAKRPLSLAHGWASLPALRYRFAWLRLAAELQGAGRLDLAREARALAEHYGACLHSDCP